MERTPNKGKNMATVFHHGNRGDQSRPRDLLIRRSLQRLKETAERMGFEVRQRATKDEVIELITTDRPVEAEQEAPVEPVVDPVDAEAGGEAE